MWAGFKCFAWDWCWLLSAVCSACYPFLFHYNILRNWGFVRFFYLSIFLPCQPATDNLEAANNSYLIIPLPLNVKVFKSTKTNVFLFIVFELTLLIKLIITCTWEPWVRKILRKFMFCKEPLASFLNIWIFMT